MVAAQVPYRNVGGKMSAAPDERRVDAGAGLHHPPDAFSSERSRNVGVHTEQPGAKQ